MARKLYETGEHLEAELIAMQEFSDKFRYRFEKLPIQYRLDFAVFSQTEKSVKGMVEVKCRKHSWSRFPTLIMSLKKIMQMRDYSKIGINSIVLLKNDDGLWFWKYNPDDLSQIEWGGRYVGGPKKPRDTQDSEPVVHLARSVFKIVIPAP